MATSTTPDASAIAGLQWPAGIDLQKPDSGAFKRATERWTIYEAPSFVASLSPTTENQVAEIVKVATANKIPFLATGSRHGYGQSLGKLQNGLSIDLSNLNTLDIDTSSETVTVGPGVKIGDIIGPISEAGYQMPIGSCPQVSVIGATLGGGVGLYQGLLGLMIDALESVRLVTARGDVVEASASENAELFFGVRGAGFNFGVVTSATYRLTKAVNEGRVFTADIVFPRAMASSYFSVLKTFEDTMPAELAINTAINWNDISGQTQIVGTFVYSGPEPDALRVLAPFFALGGGTSSAIRQSVVPYSQVPYVIAFGMVPALGEPGDAHSVWTANVRRFSLESLRSAFDRFEAFYEDHVDGRMSVAVLETFANHAVVAARGADNNTTAYPWRESKGNFMFQMAWSELGSPVEQAANDLAQSLRQDFAVTSGFPDLAVYVSYAHSDEKLEQIYGHHLPRLVALKKQWDPENVFRYNNGLPTELP